MSSTPDIGPGRPTQGEATRVSSGVAALCFRGPAGQIAVFCRLLVGEKRWLGDGRFLHAPDSRMLLPGPEAQEQAAPVSALIAADCLSRRQLNRV